MLLSHTSLHEVLVFTFLSRNRENSLIASRLPLHLLNKLRCCVQCLPWPSRASPWPVGEKCKNDLLSLEFETNFKREHAVRGGGGGGWGVVRHACICTYIDTYMYIHIMNVIQTQVKPCHPELSDASEGFQPNP